MANPDIARMRCIAFQQKANLESARSKASDYADPGVTMPLIWISTQVIEWSSASDGQNQPGTEVANYTRLSEDAPTDHATIHLSFFCIGRPNLVWKGRLGRYDLPAKSKTMMACLPPS